ncbi:MAG: hypothetical protein C5B56_07730 [Proteobacteria bacterium]|nr:MAG: hypothetical protein C5B56_07730 [Pseudomonadota bacterium]
MSDRLWPLSRESPSWFGARVRRSLLGLVALLAAFTLIGFFLLPVLLRPVLEDKLSSALERTVTIGKLAINPFVMSLTLDDVAVSGRGPGPSMLTVAELYVNGEMASLVRRAPVIKALRATRPSLHLVRNDDKTYNFSDILERALAGPPGPPPRFLVSNIEIQDGEIAFDDRPEHREHKITQLTLGIPFLSSLPSQTEITVLPKFAAQVNGRPVAIVGETRPFKDTHETVLHFDLGDLPLPAYMEYVPVALPIKVESGIVGGKVDMSFIGGGKDAPKLILAGTLKLSDLAVSERSGMKLIRVPSLDVSADRFDVFGSSADLRSIAADGVELDLRRNARGELDLAALFPDAEPKKDETPFRFHVGSVKVARGIVRLADASVNPAFISTLSDVSVGIDKLSSSGDQKANIVFSFSSDTGARVAHHGTIALAPLRAEGRLEMTGLHLGKLFPYYASALNLAVDDGILDGATDLAYGGSSGEFTLTALDATASDLKLRLPDEKDPLWRVPKLSVHGGAVDVTKHTINFASVEGRGAAAIIRRDAKGAFNFERLIRTPEGGAAPAADADTWRVAASKVALDDFAATFVDETVSPPVRIALSKVSAAGEDLSNAAKAKGKVRLQATVNRRGTISLIGPLATAPFAANLSVVARNIDLVPFQPYISQSARIIVTAGNASARGALDYAAGTPARGAFKGDVVIADMASLDEANEADLLKWKALTLAGVDARLEPLAVNVGDITLDGFFARLLLNETGEFNLQQLSRARSPATELPKPTTQPGTVEVAAPAGEATTWLKLGKATLSDGSIDFTDHFIRPNYSANLTGLAGSLSSLAFDKPADIELNGRVQGSAPLQISGRINPLAKNLFLDIKATATDIDLPPLSPYSGKYVGYGIDKGKLSMTVAYVVDNRSLKAANSIVLDQLTFGSRVESPDAIKAPVLLAAALLKDRNGVIRFDLPVSGSLDDPQFSVGGIIFRAIVGLIVKIVTAPFAILGALGGHGEELAFIEFAPGSAAIDTTGNDKIKAVAKALSERPAIKLDIAGRVEPAADRDALKHAAVMRQVKAQKFNDLVRGGEPPASVEAVEVSTTEYEALLVRAYKAASFTKPRNAIGLPSDIPRAEMEALLLEDVKVTDEDLRSLADRRAHGVREKLVDVEHAPSERVFLVAPRLDAEGVKDKGKPTRVDFALH